MITRADVEAIREHWPRKTNRDRGGNIGADRALKRLRHLFNWAIEQGYITETPFRTGGKTMIHFAAEQPRRRRLEGDEEMRRLQHAASPLMNASIIAALDTGCPRGELRSLRWEHVNLTRGCINLPGAITKNGRDRTVPFDPKGRLAGVLEMRRNTRPATNCRPTRTCSAPKSATLTC